MNQLDLLVVDDEPNIRRTLEVHLLSTGHRVRTVSTAEEAVRAAEQQSFDVAFVDIRLGSQSGLDVLPRLRQASPRGRLVVMTAYASIDTAVEALRKGAEEYLRKPFQPSDLDLVLERLAAVDVAARRLAALEQGRTEEEPPPFLESRSPRLREVLDAAERVAGSDVRVLLRGESGTGKNVLAEHLHRLSPRGDRPFVVVPCPAVPSELLESELFGHVRGAFTGATRDSAGRIALAEGGTLLLDEIADLPLALQPKLLRFLQDRCYERVGDPTTRKADVRVLAATNRDLEEAIRAGRFREDLLYRLKVISLELPPLRERPEDVVPLAESFLDHFARRLGRGGLTFSSAARTAIASYRWPGNLRELRNAIERAAILTVGEVVEADDLGIAGGDEGAAPGIGARIPLAELEREHIRRVVASTSSFREAAEVLGIDETTLWRKRKQYDL
jgi:NtrC-family two-component system response regulator AlgB